MYYVPAAHPTLHKHDEEREFAGMQTSCFFTASKSSYEFVTCCEVKYKKQCYLIVTIP